MKLVNERSARIIRDFPDFVVLARQHYETKGTEVPSVVPRGQNPSVFTNETSCSYEYLHKGLISKRQFTLIRTLSEFIKLEDQYIVICDVLGRLYSEYYRQNQVPAISWMHEAEVTLTLFVSDDAFSEKAKIGGIDDAFNMCELEPHCNEALVMSGYDLPAPGDSLSLLQGQDTSDRKDTPSSCQEKGERVDSMQGNEPQIEKAESTISKSSSDPGSMHSFGTSTYSIENKLKRDKGVENLVEILERESDEEEISETPGIVNINLPKGSIKRKISPKEFLEGLHSLWL